MDHSASELIRARKLPRHLQLAFTCATRAFTNLLTRVVGMGLSAGNWMVPLDWEKPFSSSLNASIIDAVGNRLQWLEKAAYQTKTLPRLIAGIL